MSIRGVVSSRVSEDEKKRTDLSFAINAPAEDISISETHVESGCMTHTLHDRSHLIHRARLLQKLSHWHLRRLRTGFDNDFTLVPDQKTEFWVTRPEVHVGSLARYGSNARYDFRVHM